MDQSGSPKKYDVAIIGGGLAGLSLAIQSARAGFTVILFEKEKYPYHKVCGEYISMESYGFLENLGLDLKQMNLPFIKKFQLTSPSGKSLTNALDHGGFGISRYTLDQNLALLARNFGAEILEETKVQNLEFKDEVFTIKTSTSIYNSAVTVAAFGKRSNLDVKWKRDFISRKPNPRNNLIGIKYHVEYDQAKDLIALHNFKNGYCGISAIEENKYCLCYLTTASNLKRYNNSIPAMEKEILCKNPYLQKIFSSAKFLYSSPVSISQISFDKKNQVQDHVLMTGDSAGLITPLCGNGMSMALQSGKISFQCIIRFLSGSISRIEMEDLYRKQWTDAFAKRLSFGRSMQNIFGKVRLTNIFITLIKPFPSIIQWLISKSHGNNF